MFSRDRLNLADELDEPRDGHFKYALSEFRRRRGRVLLVVLAYRRVITPGLAGGESARAHLVAAAC
jgi:hypothetical protein